MNEGNEILTTVAGEATKALAKDIYADGLAPTVKAVGGVLAGPFEVVRALMSPLRAWARDFEARFTQVGELVSEKLKDVPPGKYCSSGFTYCSPRVTGNFLQHGR